MDDIDYPTNTATKLYRERERLRREKKADTGRSLGSVPTAGKRLNPPRRGAAEGPILRPSVGPRLGKE